MYIYFIITIVLYNALPNWELSSFLRGIIKVSTLSIHHWRMLEHYSKCYIPVFRRRKLLRLHIRDLH